MELSAVIEILKHSPALAVMGGIVWMFLKNLRAITERSHTIQDRTVDALVSTKQVIGENSRVLEDTRSVIQNHTRELEIRRRMQGGNRSDSP